MIFQLDSIVIQREFPLGKEWNSTTKFFSYYFTQEFVQWIRLFEITESVDVTDYESIFFFYFCHPIFVSAVYNDNDWWIKNFQLELILSIDIFPYPLIFQKWKLR